MVIKSIDLTGRKMVGKQILQIQIIDRCLYNPHIVFHSWGMVSDEEVFPDGTSEGWECPAISNNAFTEIDAYLKIADLP